MSRVSLDVDPTVAQSPALAAQGAPGTIAPVGLDPDDHFGGNALPTDHPRWMNDTLSISARARALLQKTKPIVVRVITSWDHTIRQIDIGGRTLKVDASGSYRFE